MTRRIVSSVALRLLLVVALITAVLMAWPHSEREHRTGSATIANEADAEPGVVQEPRRDSARTLPRSLAKPASEPVDEPAPPGDGSLWASNVLALREAAEGGDPAAAIQLFEESHACWLYHEVLELAVPAMLADDRVFQSASSDAEDFDREEAELHRLQRIIEAAAPLCAGSDARNVAILFQKSLFRAAALVHLPAQSCYLSGPKVPRWASAEYSDALVDEYLAYAPIFAENVLHQGEWSATQHLVYRLVASDPFSAPSRLDQLPLPDPYLTWRAARLAYYRTKPEQLPFITQMLDVIADRYQLSDADQQRADQWAQHMYDTQYSGLPSLEDLQNTPSCPDVP